MISRDETRSDFYIAGGPLPPDAPSYVKRPADDELFNSVLEGHLCYVLTSHHMGKSSLLIRTAWRLQQQGVSTATIDLSGISTDVSIEQSYLVLIKRLKFQLELPIDPDSWWEERASFDAVQRFTDFLHDVVLAGARGSVVIFVDEIDAALNLDFSDGLFSTIRSIYQARTTDSAYKRLTFVLLGGTTLADLVKDKDQTLFDLGQKTDLHEFSWEEAQVLGRGLQATCGDQAEAIFARIFYWTHGHPYLTQRLCLNVAKMWDGHWDDERVDGLVDRLFLSTRGREEPNLRFVTDSVRASPQRRRLLTLYRRVHAGKEVPEDDQSIDESRLKRLGLVRSDHGSLKVRNQIYRQAFGPDWISANMPVNWARHIGLILILLVFLVTGVVGFSIRKQEQQATEAQALIDRFMNTASPEERLTSLAGLFTIRGYEDQARRLFYEEISPADQLALFDVADPRAVGEQLVTVVRGVYTDPNLENNAQDNTLLGSLAQPLPQLEHSPSLGAIELELEVTQWLKGREYYSQAEYQQALGAYDVAISMNDHNPGTYFDRGQAYAGLGETSRALADFVTVLSLDQGWQARVRQALLSDSQLYMALWDKRRESGALVALVPTPTSTPTSTATPEPSPTPASTDTPAPPTSTPTMAPTATPTATPTPTTASAPIIAPTPTPGVPAGTFTLLNPVSLDTPSYGPTDFEWQWTDTVRPGFGFEVRVWREGELPVGVHNAVLDNQNGNVKGIGENRYGLSVDIKEAPGVQGSGIYMWTVALVQISPAYADLGQQAESARLRFEAAGGGDDGDGDSGGGGVGID